MLGVSSPKIDVALLLLGKSWEETVMSIVFQIALAALVLMSFAMIIGVPVAYASPRNWEQSKRLILLGSIVWVALVLLVGGLNYLVV
jgi:photosystem II PsbZ protein